MQVASELNPSDASLVADVARIQNLMKCAGLKAMGDSAYRARNVAGAIKQYTAALSFDPSFVSYVTDSRGGLAVDGAAAPSLS